MVFTHLRQHPRGPTGPDKTPPQPSPIQGREFGSHPLRGQIAGRPESAAWTPPPGGGRLGGGSLGPRLPSVSALQPHPNPPLSRGGSSVRTRFAVRSPADRRVPPGRLPPEGGGWEGGVSALASPAFPRFNPTPTLPYPGEGVRFAPASRSDRRPTGECRLDASPRRGEVGRGGVSALASPAFPRFNPTPTLPYPGEGVRFAPASRSDRRPTGECRLDASPRRGEVGRGESALASLQRFQAFAPPQPSGEGIRVASTAFVASLLAMATGRRDV